MKETERRNPKQRGRSKGAETTELRTGETNQTIENEERTMSKIDTILFDFDGTIMDTNDVILQSWQHTFRTLTGKEGNEDEILVTFGEPLEISIRNFFPEIPVEESIAVYRRFQYDNFLSLIELFPGMKELVAEVKQRGYKVGLVTSRLKFTTMQGIEKFGLAEYFDDVVTAEDTTKYKPDPEPILVMLDKLGSKPENAVMLGDTLFDIRCARNAGVQSILVSWSLALGGKSAADLGADAPDHIINRPEELFDVII